MNSISIRAGNKRSLLKIILAATFLAVAFAFPVTAFAGDSSSDGNGGHHGGSGTDSAIAALGSVRWNNLNPDIRNDIYAAGYYDVLSAEVGQYVAMPFYDTRPQAGFKPGAWFRWNTIIRLWQISDNLTYPNQGLDGRLITYMLDKGYYIDTQDRYNDFGRQRVRWWWNPGVGQFVDAVWVSERTVFKQSNDVFITYVEDSDGVSVNDKDKSAEWLWSNGRKEAEYHDKTKPEEHIYKNVIHAEFTNVVKHVKEYQKMDQNGYWYTQKADVWYEKTGVTNSDKKITYKTVAPTIKQEKYRPYNLNRNNYATAADISSDYANANESLSASVDNKQGVTDNRELNALDINSNTDFRFKFNTPFGMPERYNWQNNPPALANGTWENSGSSYANNKNKNADSDGFLRHNLSFFASISANSKDASKDSSSLVAPDKTEIPARDVYTKNYGGKGSFDGGDWSSKFTLNDTYTTDNNQGGELKSWWINKYSESRFYEYGTEYWGKINTSGIQDPYKVSHGDYKNNGGSFDIVVDGNKTQRGLYVAMATQKFEQPVLYGKWKVKTVAGDIN